MGQKTANKVCSNLTITRQHSAQVEMYSVQLQGSIPAHVLMYSVQLQGSIPAHVEMYSVIK